MATPATNRDLYLAIGDIASHHRSCVRTLEQYLLALLGLAQQYSYRPGMASAEFAGLVSNAFTSEVLAFDSSWPAAYDALNTEHPGFDGWQATIIRQIVDLHEMGQASTLANEYRYFGIDAPRGGRWYNFDPAAYIECAAHGAMEGWEPGDDTGRVFVPGEVAVLDSSGEVHFADPRDIPRPIVELGFVSWGLFKDFLECGQWYE